MVYLKPLLYLLVKLEFFIITATGFSSQQSFIDQVIKEFLEYLLMDLKISTSYVSSQNANMGTASLNRLLVPYYIHKNYYYRRNRRFYIINY